MKRDSNMKYERWKEIKMIKDQDVAGRNNQSANY